MTEPNEEPTTKSLNATVFEWTIDNFMSREEIVINSDSFTIPGCPGIIKWKMMCYLKFKGDDEYTEFLFVYLNKLTDDCRVDFNKCRVGIIGIDGSVKLKRDLPSECIILGDDTSAWGGALVSRDELKDLLVDGELKLRVKINQIDVMIDDESTNQSLISQQFKFDNRQQCDVRLKTDGKTFEAHKFILAQQSPYFDTMFNGEFKEKDDEEVDLTKFRSDVIEEVLRFIYTRQVFEFDKLSEQLLVAADYFQMDYLKSLCQNNMKFRISIKNCFHFLVTAEQYNLANLKKVAMRFINKNREGIDKSVFENFFEDNVALAVDLYRCKDA